MNIIENESEEQGEDLSKKIALSSDDAKEVSPSSFMKRYSLMRLIDIYLSTNLISFMNSIF